METGPTSIIDTPTPIWRTVLVASIVTGVQFGWALQLSLLTPYVQTLDVPHASVALIWLCGPISGLLVQPIIDYYNDHCTSRFGRRCPFITGGACFVTITVFLIDFAKDIRFHADDPIHESAKPRAVTVFIIEFWCLDVVNNMSSYSDAVL